jgi:ribonuclease VapC
MVVDASAIVAIFLREIDAPRFLRAIEAAERPLISAASVVETSMVLIGRSGPTARQLVVEFLRDGNFQIEPVTADQASIAVDAFLRYGKGRHRAGLNFGDCFVYALAKATGEPLLYKGNDFAQTDVASA